MKPRVRFAPSPTGHLHIGGARTALFNRLFALKTGGTYVLRIEDTDELRSTEDSVKAIFDGLQWMGLSWQEGPLPEGGEHGDFGPYFQAERAKRGIYQPFIDKLLSEGKAYHCYCSTEELDEMRRRAQLEKRPPRYDGRCRQLTAEQKAAFQAQGRKPVLRFRMPDDGVTEFQDLIHGSLRFENKLLYDFIMVKASGYPTYNFACVIDDHLMQISHVVRGDDHISNTPLQYQLYKALGWEPPVFAHLSMILGPDGTRLSKRHGHTGVQEYRKMGLLPEALRNYLALLGWSTADSQQIFAPGELESKFNIEGCQKSPATFDPVKLNWMNGEYIRQLSADQLLERALPYLQEAGVGVGADREYLKKVVCLEQEKYKLLAEIPKLVDFFFLPEPVFDAKSVEKVLKKPEAPAVLEAMRKKYAALGDFTEGPLELEARACAKELGLKAGQVFHPLRVAVSGRTEGPTLFRMLEYLGREKVLQRLEKAAALCAV
ncbi:MAG TPA: glutamate--tRNA ligase [Elusimicrobiales bacterium]|nr:glutamate--tRNA ligase [Elusimicrobiales bacterium]